MSGFRLDYLLSARPQFMGLSWRPGFNPWVGKIPWMRKWQPTPVFLPGESHGQRSLVGAIVYKVLKSHTWLNTYIIRGAWHKETLSDGNTLVRTEWELGKRLERPMDQQIHVGVYLGIRHVAVTPAVTAPEIRPLSKKLEWLIMTFKPVRETEEIPINSEERESGKVPRKGRGCSRWPLGGWRSPRRAPLWWPPRPPWPGQCRRQLWNPLHLGLPSPPSWSGLTLTPDFTLIPRYQQFHTVPPLLDTKPSLQTFIPSSMPKHVNRWQLEIEPHSCLHCKINKMSTDWTNLLGTLVCS